MSERYLTKDELFEEIVAALHAMPKRLRDAFIASHYRGLSAAEIAAETGVSPAEVAGLVKQANRYFYQKIGSSPEMEGDLVVRG